MYNKSAFIIALLVVSFLFIRIVAASSIDFSQCANGASPSTSTNCTDGWTNGMLQSSNSHYHEDEVVPQRLVLSGSLGIDSVTINYDTKNNGVHAYDSLATWNYTTKTADRCQGLADCPDGDVSVFAIPDDPTNVSPSGNGTGIPFVTNATSAHMIPKDGGRVIVMYGGIITNVSVPTHSSPLDSNDIATVTITYNVTNPSGKVMILFGGHLAPSVLVRGWGNGLGASNINGNFQTKLGSGGSRTNQVATGTILPIPGNITINKVTIPSPDPLTTSFSFTTTGGLSSTSFSLVNGGSLNFSNVDSKVYTVTENSQPGYDLTSINCVSDLGSSTTTNAGTVTITLGGAGNVACTFYNTFQQPTLTVFNHVINNNGGTATASNFNLHVKYTNGTDISGSPAAGSETGTTYQVLPGAFAVSEDNSISGYTQTDFSGDCDSSGQVTINVGEHKTCTITNDDIPGQIKIIKNTLGGDGQFNFTITGTNSSTPSILTSGGTGNTGFITVNAGTYSASENVPAGWDLTGSSCDSGTPASFNVPLNGTVTCAFNNTKRGHLIVNKSTVPDSDTETLFSITTSGTGSITGLTTRTITGGTTQDYEVTSGTYSVSEDASTGWIEDISNCQDVSVGVGQTVDCTIINTKLPLLTVTKIVVNDNGGSGQVSDFPLFVDNNPVTSGVQNIFSIGSHVASETNQDGYTATIGGECAADGTINLQAGDVKSCTITNDDQSGTLIVKKVIVNDNGGTKAAQDFSFSVNGGDAIAFESDGQNDLTVNAGTYNVSEPSVIGYDTTYDNCENVYVPNGGSVTCTITNDDKPAKITLIKNVINDNDGTAGINDFGMTVDSTGVNSGDTVEVTSNEPHTINEAGLFGYNFVNITGDAKCPSALGDNVTLGEGEKITCTITNDDIQPKLTITKVVTNDNGGTMQESDFNLSVNDTQVMSGVQNGFSAGTYAVSEISDPRYNETISGDCSPDGTIFLNVGDVKSCTITNDDIPGILTVIVNVNGTASASDFNISVTGNSPVPSNFPGTESPGTNVTLSTGLYAVDETGPSGYNTTFSSDCYGTINIGEVKTCVITNDYIQNFSEPETVGRLTVIKHVNNSDGGNSTASDFTMYITGDNVSNPSFLGDENGATVALNAGSYIVDESGPNGYVPFISSNCFGTISSNQTKTCTIINYGQAGNASTRPTLEIIKHVVNDDSESAVASNFTITVTGNNLSLNDFSGSETGTLLTLDAGIYSVDESGPNGYDPSFSSTCSGTISDGQFKTCTIVNDDKSGNIFNSPELTVIKHVINDNGGTKGASDFNINVNGMNVNGTDDSSISFAGSESGTAITLDAGNYSVSEDELFGYVSTLSSNCFGSISDGQLKTCTIINDDVQPYLTIIKHVTNDNSGSLGVNDFPLFVNATSVTSGAQNNFNAGNYVVSETQQSGYALTGIGGDCSSDGTIVLSPGDNKTCTITNDDIAPQNQPGGGGSIGGSGGFSGTTSYTSGTNQTGQTRVTVNQTCVENWSCSDWSVCANGTQTRTCADANNCGTENDKPNETQSCVTEQRIVTPALTGPTGLFLGLSAFDWLAAIITGIIAASLIIFLVRRRKNKSLTT